MNEKPTLFPLEIDATEKWRDGEQKDNARRVGGAIGEDVMSFCRSRGVDGEFRMEELRRWVESRGHRAPDSSGRILRLLRQNKRIGYKVVNRQQSHYRITFVQEDRE